MKKFVLALVILSMLVMSIPPVFGICAATGEECYAKSAGWSPGSCPANCGDKCQDAACCESSSGGEGYPTAGVIVRYHQCVSTSTCENEICNGIDDDCDGSIDEDFNANNCEPRCTVGDDAWFDAWYGDTGASANCCGNEANEYFKWKQYQADPDPALEAENRDAYACCNAPTDCTWNDHTCYPQGTLGGSGDTTGMSICQAGVWYECNAEMLCQQATIEASTYYCVFDDTTGYYLWKLPADADDDECAPLCSAPDTWITATSSFNGNTEPNCCGDDVNENYNLPKWDTTGDNTPEGSYGPPKDACCENADDCVWNSASTNHISICNAAGTLGSADNICDAGLWHYCNADTLCDTRQGKQCMKNELGYAWLTPGTLSENGLCADGIDNNCDGNIDEADSDCTLTLSISPDPVNTGEVTNAQASASDGILSTAGTKNICDASGCSTNNDGTCTGDIVCTDSLGCAFTAPSTGGTYTYWACFGENSASDEVTVVAPSTCDSVDDCSLPSPNPAGTFCHYNNQCTTVGYCAYDTSYPKPTCYGDGTLIGTTCYYGPATEAVCTSGGWGACTNGDSQECPETIEDGTSCFYSRSCTALGCDHEEDTFKACALSTCESYGWDNSACPAFCGNDVAEGDEQCDGIDLEGTECSDFPGYNGGTLACFPAESDDECMFDLSGCISTPEICDNGIDDDDDFWFDERDAECGIGLTIDPNVVEPSTGFDRSGSITGLLTAPVPLQSTGGTVDVTFTADDGGLYAAQRRLCDSNGCSDIGTCEGAEIFRGAGDATTLDVPSIEDVYTYYFCFGENSAKALLYVCSAGNCPNCGDGTITSGEECDDGNVADGDCCSSTCEIEPGCECYGEPSTCELNPSKINGTVYFLDSGLPVTDETVTLVLSSTSGDTTIEAGADATFLFENVETGDYALRASSPSYGSDVAAFSLDAGETETANLYLREPFCGEGCTDEFGECNYECLGTITCDISDVDPALQNHLQARCTGAMPGERRSILLPGYEGKEFVCCGDSTLSDPVQEDQGQPVEIEGCAPQLVKFTRVVNYQGKPVKLVVLTWEQCEA